MDRFEAESMALLPGQRVRVRILSHHPWGVKAEIIGHEQVGASADLTGQSGAAVSPDKLPAVFPRVGAENRCGRAAGPAMGPACTGTAEHPARGSGVVHLAL
jgi:hypothetical protein